MTELEKAARQTLEYLDRFVRGLQMDETSEAYQVADTMRRALEEQSSVEQPSHCEAGPEFCQQCQKEAFEDRSLALAAAFRYIKNHTPHLVWTEIERALQKQPAQQEIDWKDQYEKQKRRAEMWIAKYEADIGSVEKAGPVAAQQEPLTDEQRADAARYRFLAEKCRSTSEHWGGRWSIVIEGPAPKTHDSEDDFDEAIDRAIEAAHGITSGAATLGEKK